MSNKETNDRNYMHVETISFDPGGTTGVAIKYDTGKIEVRQLGPYKHHETLWRVLEKKNPVGIVYERFVYQRRELSSGVSLNLQACEYIGVIELWASMHGINPVQQGASEVKKFCTEDKMKVWGFDLPHAQRHAKDALRHLVFYETFVGKDKTWLLKLRDQL